MKRYFLQTNADSNVMFVDDDRKRAFVFGEQCFDRPLTLESARNEDYSNLVEELLEASRKQNQSSMDKIAAFLLACGQKDLDEEE